MSLRGWGSEAVRFLGLLISFNMIKMWFIEFSKYYFGNPGATVWPRLRSAARRRSRLPVLPWKSFSDQVLSRLGVRRAGEREHQVGLSGAAGRPAEPLAFLSPAVSPSVKWARTPISWG